MNSNDCDLGDGDETNVESSRFEDLEGAMELNGRVRRSAGDWNSTDEIRRWRDRRGSAEDG